MSWCIVRQVYDIALWRLMDLAFGQPTADSEHE